MLKLITRSFTWIVGWLLECTLKYVLYGEFFTIVLTVDVIMGFFNMYIFFSMFKF
jgi:hypothetical protein